MFIELTKSKVMLLLDQEKIQQISRWDSVQNAYEFYKNQKNNYVCYKEDIENLENAFSTPVFIYLLVK